MTDASEVQKADKDKDTEEEDVALVHSRDSSQDGRTECSAMDGVENEANAYQVTETGLLFPETDEGFTLKDKDNSIEKVHENLADDIICLDEDEPVNVYGQGLPHNIESEIPLLDQDVLSDLEQHAKRVADSLGLMTGHLTNALHYMSAITMHCMDSYQQAATELGQTVDVSIKTMYALIAKCEAIANSMEPVEELAQQVYDIKRTLDTLERLCK